MMKHLACTIALALPISCAEDLERNEAHPPLNTATKYECTKFVELFDAVHEYDGFLFGELHGTQEVGEVIYCLIEFLSAERIDFNLSLELSVREEWRLKRLIEFGADGVSVATPETVCSIQAAKNRFDFDIEYHVSDTGKRTEHGSFDTNHSERMRAHLIRETMKKASFTIALAGNVHAQEAYAKDPQTGVENVRLGYLVPDTMATIRIINSQGGAARNCLMGGACDIHAARPIGSGPVYSLKTGDLYRYDHVFDVGSFSPSSAENGYAECEYTDESDLFRDPADS